MSFTWEASRRAGSAGAPSTAAEARPSADLSLSLSLSPCGVSLTATPPCTRVVACPSRCQRGGDCLSICPEPGCRRIRVYRRRERTRRTTPSAICSCPGGRRASAVGAGSRSTRAPWRRSANHRALSHVGSRDVHVVRYCSSRQSRVPGLDREPHRPRADGPPPSRSGETTSMCRPTATRRALDADAFGHRAARRGGVVGVSSR